MTVVVLARHGRTRANVEGLLAGWTPGVSLDETGRAQALRLGQRLADAPVVAVVSSPLDRCLETANAIREGHTGPSPDGAGPGAAPALHTDGRLGEAHYGAWTGRSLKELAREPLWRAVQDRPSSVTFPPDPAHRHESLQQMQTRALEAVDSWHARIAAEHGPHAVWVAVSHGDVIKALLADALGTPLDRFQRIVIDPGSLSIVQQSARHPVVLRVNDTGGDPVRFPAPPAEQVGEDGDAPVGGGAGSV